MRMQRGTCLLENIGVVAIALFLVEPCIVHARRGLTGSGSLIQLSSEGDCSPGEVHLSLADSVGSVRVAWRTRGSGCPSTIAYGKSDGSGQRLSGQPLRESDGSSYTISEDLMCEAPAKEKPFTVNMHTSVMHDLEPNTEYWYSVDGSDRSFTFRSPPVVGADQPFSFIAFGDMGESHVRRRKSPMAAATVDAIVGEMDRRPVDMVLHMGDLAYADGKYKVWDEFMALIERVSSRVPYMIGIGNHEAGPCSHSDNDPSGEDPYSPDWGNYGPESGGECGAMTAHRFIMPGTELAARGGAFASALTGAEARSVPVEAEVDADAEAEAEAEADEAPSIASSDADGVGRHQRRLAMSGKATVPGAGSVIKAAAGAVNDGAEQDVTAQDVAADAAGEDEDDDDTEDDDEDKDDDELDAPSVDTAAVKVDPRAAPSTSTAADAEGAGAAVGPAVGRRHRHRDAKAKNPPFWYSFDYGTVHFTLLSSEHDLSAGSTQQRWLEADLALVDRCRTPWLVVGVHRPLYVVYPHKDNRIVGEHIRGAIEDLLLRHRVDLVVSGHVHAYYRSCSAAGGKCADERAGGQEGITHLVIGTGGKKLSGVEDDQKDWCEQVLNEYGFGRFDIDGDQLHFSFIRSEDGRVADTLTLRSKVAPGDACSGSSSRGWKTATTGAVSAVGQQAGNVVA